MWCRYCYGTTESGAVIEPNDPDWARLQATAKAAKADPMAWLAMADIYGDVGKAPAMREAFSSSLGALWKDGVQKTVQAYLAR